MTTMFDPPERILIDGTTYGQTEAWHRTADHLRSAPRLLRVAADGLFPFWAVTRHAEIMEIERQHEIFPNTEESVLLPMKALAEQRALGVQIKSLVHMDDPEHAKYRRLTNDWFKPSNLRRLFEARIAELATRYVDRMAAMGTTCDFARAQRTYLDRRQKIEKRIDKQRIYQFL